MPSVLDFTPDTFAESWRWAQAIVPALRGARRPRSTTASTASSRSRRTAPR